MQLDELKKSMSTLDQLLAKTNTDIKINVSTSETAKSKILKNSVRDSPHALSLRLSSSQWPSATSLPFRFPTTLK